MFTLKSTLFDPVDCELRAETHRLCATEYSEENDTGFMSLATVVFKKQACGFSYT